MLRNDPLFLGPIAAAYLNIEFKRPHGLLQDAVPLLLRQLHAVHPAAVQLLEEVGAGHAREGKEGQTLASLQAHGLLGDPAQDLPSRQVAQVAGVGVSNEELWVLLTDLEFDKYP